MDFKTKVAGAFRNTSNRYSKVAGVWRNNDMASVKVSNVWKHSKTGRGSTRLFYNGGKVNVGTNILSDDKFFWFESDDDKYSGVQLRLSNNAINSIDRSYQYGYIRYIFKQYVNNTWVTTNYFKNIMKKNNNVPVDFPRFYTEIKRYKFEDINSEKFQLEILVNGYPSQTYATSLTCNFPYYGMAANEGVGVNLACNSDGESLNTLGEVCGRMLHAIEFGKVENLYYDSPYFPEGTPV